MKQRLYIRIVVVSRELPVDIAIEDFRKAPAHYLRMKECEEKMVLVEYKPSEGMDHDQFAANVQQALRKVYRTVLEMQILQPPTSLTA